MSATGGIISRSGGASTSRVVINPVMPTAAAANTCPTAMLSFSLKHLM